MDTIESIVKYMEFLEKNYSMYVSVHCFDGSIKAVLPKFGKYGVHYHPFCMYIKSYPQLWRACRLMQRYVLKGCGGEISCGRCYCGVDEFVLPIYDGERKIGFISVTGGCADKKSTQEQLKKISRSFGISCEELAEKADLLSPTLFSIDFIEGVLLHISKMLSMLAKESYIGCENSDTTNYIYSNAVAYIHEHFTEQLSVDEVATFCKCSRSYITHIFKPNSGKGFREYINQLRIEAAKELLRKNEMSVKKIAFSVGYNDSNYFSNVFYKETGFYPCEYRRKKL